jgi:anti-sigma factor RsiW
MDDVTAGAGLTCRELVELVTDYVEGALAPSEVVRFDAHIAGCGKCSAHLEQMRMTIELTGRLTEERADPTALDALMKVFRQWKQGAGSGA